MLGMHVHVLYGIVYCMDERASFVYTVFLHFYFVYFADYKFRKDELFKRMKITTFAQLVSDCLAVYNKYIVCEL